MRKVEISTSHTSFRHKSENYICESRNPLIHKGNSSPAINNTSTSPSFDERVVSACLKADFQGSVEQNSGGGRGCEVRGGKLLSGVFFTRKRKLYM